MFSALWLNVKDILGIREWHRHTRKKEIQVLLLLYHWAIDKRLMGARLLNQVHVTNILHTAWIRSRNGRNVMFSACSQSPRSVRSAVGSSGSGISHYRMSWNSRHPVAHVLFVKLLLHLLYSRPWSSGHDNFDVREIWIPMHRVLLAIVNLKAVRDLQWAENLKLSKEQT